MTLTSRSCAPRHGRSAECGERKRVEPSVNLKLSSNQCTKQHAADSHKEHQRRAAGVSASLSCSRATATAALASSLASASSRSGARSWATTGTLKLLPTSWCRAASVRPSTAVYPRGKPISSDVNEPGGKSVGEPRLQTRKAWDPTPAHLPPPPVRVAASRARHQRCGRPRGSTGAARCAPGAACGSHKRITI
jgi:hypothetical protein